jgi:hypothetical protein
MPPRALPPSWGLARRPARPRRGPGGGLVLAGCARCSFPCWQEGVTRAFSWGRGHDGEVCCSCSGGEALLLVGRPGGVPGGRHADGDTPCTIRLTRKQEQPYVRAGQAGAVVLWPYLATLPEPDNTGDWTDQELDALVFQAGNRLDRLGGLPLFPFLPPGNTSRALG